MKCPKCGGKTRVRDSRSYHGTTRRRRVCLICGGRFSTVEEILPQTEQSKTWGEIVGYQGVAPDPSDTMVKAKQTLREIIADIREEIYEEQEERWYS